MRLLVDANVLLDCLILESSGTPRSGQQASNKVLGLCDSGSHQGLVAWHTLPIIAYYHGRQHSREQTAEMIDMLLGFLEVPTVAHADATQWRVHGLSDFEDALQVAAAASGMADMIITRNTGDFANCRIPAMTPESFLSNYL